MGACYSKSGHDTEQTPKHKSPFHKKQHKNGVAITIEYSPVRSHDEEKLSICNPGEDDCIQREGSINGDANDNNKTLDKNLHKGDKYVNDGVATSDSGIESLSPHDAVAGDIPEKSSSQETFHDCETDHVDCDKETDQYISENNCPSGSRDAENVFHDQNRRITNSSVPSSPLRKEGVILRQNSLNLEHVRLEFPNSKRASQEIRRFDSEASLELSSAFASLQDVKTMQIDGKDVVVIDADTYSQIMEELAMLKFRLSQLTDLIQEQELAQLETSQEKSADVFNTSKES